MISLDNNSRLNYPDILLLRHSCHTFHSSPRLAAWRWRQVSRLLFKPALFNRPVDLVAPALGLRHGQAPNARPPAPILPQPRLTSYTLLPLRPSAAAASAVPNWNALPLRCQGHLRHLPLRCLLHTSRPLESIPSSTRCL